MQFADFSSVEGCRCRAPNRLSFCRAWARSARARSSKISRSNAANMASNAAMTASFPVMGLSIVELRRQMPASAARARVRITVAARTGVGGPDEMDTIAGTVSGGNPNEVKVLIYAHAGDRWWIQPFEDAPFYDSKR